MFRALACHRPLLASRSGALARCFLVSTTTHAPGLGRSWRFTDAPRTIHVLEGDGAYYEYQPLVAVEADSTERVAMLGDNTTKLTISTISDDSFDAQDGRLGLLESALVYEFDVDWRFPWLPPLRVFRWRVTDVSPEADAVRLNLAGISDDLRRDIGNQFQPGCFNEFGDSLCDFGGSISASSSFRFRSYVISAATAPTRNSFTVLEDVDTFPAASTSAPDWWARGVLHFTSGVLSGHKVVVESNTQPAGSPLSFVLRLVTATELKPSAGDTIDLRVGCDRARATCKAKFSNLDNFRGFDLVPGSDLQRKTPEAK